MRFLGALLLAGSLLGADFYASPSGTPSGTGAIDRAWDLQTALNQPAALKPGDTLWLRGGRYTGRFTSALLGTAAARIAVKPYQNEQPIIDSAGQLGTILDIQSGGYVDIVGLDIRGSAPQRFGLDDQWISYGNCPANGIGVNVLAPSVRLINNFIHDTAQAIGLWRPGTGSELIGNILYNNGCDAPGRGHGHAIYAQNDGPAWDKITGNIVMPHWDAGFHIYGASAALNNFDIEQNILVGGTHQFGGGLPMQNWIYSGNFNAPTFWRFYYNNQYNSGLVYNDNYSLSPLPAFWWDRIEAHRNTVYNQGWHWEIRARPDGDTALTVDDTTYIRGAVGQPDYIGDINGVQWVNLADWQAAGHDLFSRVIDPPTAPVVLYFPNGYEPKRGHIAVVRWGASTAQVDLSKFGYVTGDVYSIWDAQAMGDATPLHSGTWDGTPVSVNLAYTGLTLPTGDYSPQCWNVDCGTCSPIPQGCYAHPAFAPVKNKLVSAFLVRNIAGTPTPTPTPPPPKKHKPWWKWW